MYIATVPNRTSPPAILIRESYRENGKVKSRTIANISHWDPARIEALRRALRGDFDHLACADPTSGPVLGLLYVMARIAGEAGRAPSSVVIVQVQADQRDLTDLPRLRRGKIRRDSGLHRDRSRDGRVGIIPHQGEIPVMEVKDGSEAHSRKCQTPAASPAEPGNLPTE